MPKLTEDQFNLLIGAKPTFLAPHFTLYGFNGYFATEDQLKAAREKGTVVRQDERFTWYDYHGNIYVDDNPIKPLLNE